jgi:DNA-binding transcriptional ArsR family regulator
MSKDPNAVFRSEVGYEELERLSALETLKGLKHKERVKLGELVDYLERRGLWLQFAKITMGDLRRAFTEAPAGERADGPRKRKRRILEEELGDVETGERRSAEPTDGGLSTEEVGRMLLPFIEGNGEVTLDELADYSQLDRRVLRHHLAALVKEGKLERLGMGRHAVYSTLG